MAKRPEKFWEKYSTYRKKGMSLAQIAKLFQVHTRTIQYWVASHNVGSVPKNTDQTVDTSFLLSQGITLPQRLKEHLLKTPETDKNLSERFGVPQSIIQEGIEHLKKQGIPFTKLPSGEWRIEKKKLKENTVSHTMLHKEKKIKFLLVTDTHLGNELCDLKALHDFYIRGQQEGVEIAYHSGDLIDGQGMFPGHENELLVIGADKQLKFAAENYPSYGITTYRILGNHEVKPYWDRGGRDVGRELENMRPDLPYLGQYRADIELAPNVWLRLIHPDWGVAYSEFYHIQRYIDNLPPGEKVNIVSFGHIHASIVGFRRGIHGILVGTFKRAGDWEKRKGWNTAVGGYICEAAVDTTGLVSLKLEHVTY